MGRRSSKLVVLGAVVFVAGAGLVFIGLRQSPAEQKPSATVVTSTTPSPDVVAQGAPPAPVSAIRVPAGREAVAVQLQAVPGLAGYAQPGSTINVYATVKGGPAGRLEPPYAKLVLPRVSVLDASSGTDGGEPTFLLALTTAEAERLIFYAKFESLWFSLVPDGARAPLTRGFDHSDALRGGS